MRIFDSLCLIASFTLMFFLSLDSVNMSEFELEPTMIESQEVQILHEKIDKYLEQEIFSGSILVAKNGVPIYLGAKGFADCDKRIINRPDTKYNLGSMNKMFTAIAIAQLAQEGKLNFSDPLTKYLTDYPNIVFEQVTIHHLLTHTGGTGDIFGPDYEKNIQKLLEPKDFITLYGHRSLDFKPGSKWNYSNYGFVLLGAIIEKVSGQDYYDYIQSHIYDLAGMNSSGSYWKSEKIQNLAIGYSFLEDSSFKNNDAFLPMRGTPTGGGYSTVEDLLKFALALSNNQLLNNDFTTIVTAGKVDIQEKKQYAYGFYDQVVNDIRRIGHSGGAPGINSTLRIYPTTGYIIVVMGNFSPPAADRIADFIESHLLQNW